MQWQITILLYSHVVSLANLTLQHISIKCSKDEQIHYFLSEIFQESQNLSALLAQKPGR